MKIRRIDFSPDEWLGGTVQLDNAERGLYITACALIYSAGGPICQEHLRAACRDHGNAFNRQLQRLLHLGKLSINGGQIANKRSINELENAFKRSENARQNVGKRWNNRDIASEVVLQAGNANHQPSTTNKEKDSLTRVPKESRAHRLDSKFAMSLDWIEDGAMAREKAHLPPVDLATEAVKFTNHFLSKGGRDSAKLDWHRTWINWCLNAKGGMNAARTGSAESAAAKLAAWARAEDEPESFRGYSEAAH